MVGICILVVVALLLIYRGKKDIPIEKTQNIKHVNDSRMFSIKEAVIIAVTLTIIQIVVHGLNLLLGDNGLIIGTLLASLFEIHAAMATVVMQGDIQNTVLIYAVVIGLAAHASSKCINAFIMGGFKYFLYFAPTQIIHTLCLIAVLLFLG